ncbi:MAG: cupin domain-containing protein [Bacteroidia bacterium]|nr:cupin domain-containing protein [Bacteroidia bacterium]
MSTKSPIVSVRAVTETASTHLQRIESVDEFVKNSEKVSKKLELGYLFSQDLPEFYLFPFPNSVGNDENTQNQSLEGLQKLIHGIAKKGISWEDFQKILKQTEAHSVRQPIPFSLSCFKLSMVTRFFVGRPVDVHAHDDDQFRLVMNGRIQVKVYNRYTVNDTTYEQLDTYTLSAGDWFWIQAGTPYSLAVVASQTNNPLEEGPDTPAQGGAKRMLHSTAAGAESADLFAMYMIRCCPPPPKPCRMVEVKVEVTAS